MLIYLVAKLQYNSERARKAVEFMSSMKGCLTHLGGFNAVSVMLLDFGTDIETDWSFLIGVFEMNNH